MRDDITALELLTDHLEDEISTLKEKNKNLEKEVDKLKNLVYYLLEKNQ